LKQIFFQEHGSIQASVEQMMQVIAKSRDDGKEHLLRQLHDSKTEADGLKKHLLVLLLLC